MRFFLILSLVFVTSCSHRSHYEELKSKVDSYESKNVKEIKSDVDSTLNHHPELAPGLKAEIKELINMSLNRHIELKNEESKLIQFILESTIALEKELQVKERHLRSELKDLYIRKSENIFKLVTDVKSKLGDSPGSNKIIREMEIIIREIR